MEHEHSPHDDILARTKQTPRSVTREGREQGARTALGAADPGHQVDSTESNTYRALRFVDRAPGGRGNKLYAEFTRLNDYNFTAADLHRRSAGLAQILPGPEPGGSVYGGKF